MANAQNNHREKPTHRMTLAAVGCAVFSLVLTLITTVFRDSIIIESGIRTWTFLRNLSYAAWGITACAVIASCILYFSRRRKDAALSREEHKKEQEEQEKSRQSSAYLDPNRLDPEVIASIVRDQIRRFSKGAQEGKAGAQEEFLYSDKGREVRESIKQSYLKLSEQMSEMDRYQEKLRTLLTANGAYSLSDMNDMLDKIEQHLLRQIRKVLNVQDLFSQERREDMEQLSRLLSDTVGLNETHLARVREFLFAVAEFLNNQDSGDSDLKMLETYRQTILDTMQEQEESPLSSYLQESQRERSQEAESKESGIHLTFGEHS